MQLSAWARRFVSEAARASRSTMSRRCRRTAPYAVLIAAAAVYAARAVAADAPSSDLAARLTSALAHPGLRGASVGVLVVRADDGQVVFDQGGNRLLTPASNLKNLTTLAALATFGPAYQFTTTVYADTPVSADGSVGSLAVRGGGDPALTSEEWWRLAADLYRKGLRRVRGDLILDDTYFDQQRWNPAWGGVSARAFHAPVGALAANFGSFAVEVRPARSGAAPQIGVDPPVAFFELVDRTKPGSGALGVERQDDGERDRIVVSGAPPSSVVTIYRSVSDPVRYAAAVFRMQLAALGIAVDGKDRIAPVPATFGEILAFQGKPLADAIRLLMKYSNNNIGEMLLKDLGAAQSGAPGTWENGVAAARQRLIALGLSPDGFQTVDGSGLSARNRVSSRTLVDALRIARSSFAYAPEFESALPIVGRDGTLKSRAPGAMDAIRAKTGLLDGAAALSGYAHTRGGTDLVFSLIVNDYQRGDPDALAAIDGFATALVQ
jgi:D-alanyl-D-alanine carboxypeptidase/D-alanyl-D-alanine-endopeptidase (penicillin-binding protein 4)